MSNPADVLGNNALSGNLTKYTPDRNRHLYGRGFNPNEVNLTDASAMPDDRPISKYSTKKLEFPIGVASGDPNFGNHGHYIMFYINAQENSKIRIGSEEGGGSIVDSAREYNVPKYLREWSSKDKKHITTSNKAGTKKVANDSDPDTDKDISDFFGGNQKDAFSQTTSGSNKSTIRIKRKPTKRLTTSIAMYMPASVTTTYGANYTDTDIGALSSQALQAYGAENWRGTREAIVNMDEGIKELAQKFVLKTMGAIPGMAGVEAGFEMMRGEVISDRLELAFKGINKRSFQYTFKMIPKNQAEADQIKHIVFAFKSSMMPEFKGGNREGRRLVVPNTFDIQYMYLGGSNEYLHHISTCVLENFSVQYGGDRYKTFEANSNGAPPVETQITLAFKEMELISRERVHEGY